MIQDNFYYLLSLVTVILFLVILYIAHALYHALQQIKSTARTIEEAIKSNQDLFDSIKRLSEQLNERVNEISPIIKDVNEASKKIKEMRSGIFNLLLFISNIAGGYLGRLPIFFTGLRWMLKKIKRGGDKNV